MASLGALCADSPSMARRQFAAGKSFVPMPQPMARTVIGGIAPYSVAKWVSSAAPVGVHISPARSPA